jgi:signal transduction histidine kinase
MSETPEAPAGLLPLALQAALEESEASVLAVDRQCRVILSSRAFRQRFRVTGDNAPLAAAVPSLRGTALYSLLTAAARGELGSQRVEPMPSTHFMRGRIIAKDWGALLRLDEVVSDLEAEELRWELQDDFAHAFLTPVTLIGGYTELVQAQLAADDPGRKSLDLVLRQSQLLTDRVNHLLYISRLQAGKAELEFVALDLRLLLAEVVDVIIPRVDQKGQGLRVMIPENDVPIVGDHKAVYSLMLNLLDNSIKYTPYSGRIEVEVERRPPVARLIVRDNGIGIPAEQHERVFQRFYRTEEACKSSNPGVGLGLAEVRQIVQAHGSELQLTSSPGRGTAVQVDFPLRGNWQPEA